MAFSVPASSNGPAHKAHAGEATGSRPTGAPAARGLRIWKIAALTLAILWMVKSWHDAGHLLGPAKVNHLTQDLWRMLVAATCCYGAYHFLKPRVKSLGLGRRHAPCDEGDDGFWHPESGETALNRP